MWSLVPAAKMAAAPQLDDQNDAAIAAALMCFWTKLVLVVCLLLQASYAWVGPFLIDGSWFAQAW